MTDEQPKPKAKKTKKSTKLIVMNKTKSNKAEIEKVIEDEKLSPNNSESIITTTMTDEQPKPKAKKTKKSTKLIIKNKTKSNKAEIEEVIEDKKLIPNNSESIITTTMTMNAKPSNSITQEEIEKQLLLICKTIKEQEVTMTEPGSIKYLMFGSEPSEHSLSIKMGKVGEEMIKIIITGSNNLELLTCGVQCIDPNTGKNKDLDLIWVDKSTKTIYYREAKGNIELDTEKLQATIDKIYEIINTHISPKYPDYTIDIGVFNWSIYNRNPLKKGLSHIKKCEDNDIKVEHAEDLFKLLNFNWDEENYYKFFRKVGKLFRE